MPNGHRPKAYSSHDYPNYPNKHDTSDCSHGCGCWMGPCRSGGPIGIDPFGFCPKNPLDGKLLGGDSDIENVVRQRIASLESRARAAEDSLKAVEPSKKNLAAALRNSKREVHDLREAIRKIKEIVRNWK